MSIWESFFFFNLKKLFLINQLVYVFCLFYIIGTKVHSILLSFTISIFSVLRYRYFQFYYIDISSFTISTFPVLRYLYFQFYEFIYLPIFYFILSSADSDHHSMDLCKSIGRQHTVSIHVFIYVHDYLLNISRQCIFILKLERKLH